MDSASSKECVVSITEDLFFLIKSLIILKKLYLPGGSKLYEASSKNRTYEFPIKHIAIRVFLLFPVDKTSVYLFSNGFN